MLSESAALPARWIDVAPERFPGWIASFGDRHGVVAVRRGSAGAGTEEAGPAAREPGAAVVFDAADGAVARCHAPFPPPPGLGATPDAAGAAGVIAAHAAADRTVGVLLVRLGGYAAGVFAGAPPRLAASKVGSRLVHGRSAAGGQSQQRFARRREKQAAEALAAAADTAAAVFGRWTSGITATGAPARAGSGAVSRGRRLDAVVLGGDKRAVAELRDDPRLAPYLALATERFLTVPDPKRAVLEAAPRLFTAVRIWLTEPPA
jgi:hypothetical protein